MHWGKSKIKKTKRQNKTIKHKSKHKVFLFIVKGKMKYYTILSKLSYNNMNLNQTFFFKRGNTRREFIGTCKYSVLKY